MDIKDIFINDTNSRKLVHNNEYYRHIFKKTEKIISVVFYILNHIDTEQQSETHIGNIAGKAHFAHENALRSLGVKLSNSKEVLEQFSQSLIALDSTIRISNAGGLISDDVMHVVTSEIDTVLRSLNKYILNEVDSASMLSSQEMSDISLITSHNNEQLTAKKLNFSTDRRTRIRTIIQAKGNATIKDISEIITDCSEKTVQRDINVMIADKVIKRHGEKRWSKYTVV